jgi:DNA (cytosine-5)-methyltransferase 1
MLAASLFSGVGGFELGFGRAGIETVLQAESDPWCLSVLERHWPETERHRDVRQVDAATFSRRCRDVVRVGDGADAERVGDAGRWRGDTDSADRGADGVRSLQPRDRRGDAHDADASGERVDSRGIDLVYGGFPCQDVSVAGKRAGLRAERSGLWHEFRRVLSELRPRWVVVENVPGLLSSNSGRDFATILMGMEELGYGWAYRVLDARWFGVPQRRRRVFVVGCLGDAARAAQVLAVCESCGGHTQEGGEAGQGVAASFTAGAHSAGTNLPRRHHEDDVNLVVGSGLDEGMARPLVARASGYRMDVESETFVVANALEASNGHHGYRGDRGDNSSNLVVADPISAHEGKTYSHEGRHNFRLHNVVNGVRRLTPLECERLMAFPDNWTRWTADGREISDSHRYRMCGNAVVSTVAEWIGHRLVAVENGWPERPPLIQPPIMP